jgi:hypothetical protein
MMIRYAAPLLSLALLAACGDEPTAPDTSGEAGVEGNVLEGSISDAMLPLDTITSESPSAKGASGEAGGDDEAEGE